MTEQLPPKPSDRPFYKWFVTRELWYEVVRTVLSGVILGGVGYGFALVSGYVGKPSETAVILFILLFVMPVISLSLLLFIPKTLAMYRLARQAENPTMQAMFGFMLFLCVAGPIFFLTWIIVTFAGAD